MEVQIQLPADTPHQQVMRLKEYIIASEISGIDDVAIKRGAVDADSMGGLGDLTGTITAIITAAAGPLTELVKCLNTFIEGFRTELSIEVDNKKISLKTGDPKKAEELAQSILQAIKE
ncbi:hypothetical protein ACTHGU_13435 [Chitinophagaceae bacterium MMS25-I14]